MSMKPPLPWQRSPAVKRLAKGAHHRHDRAHTQNPTAYAEAFAPRSCLGTQLDHLSQAWRVVLLTERASGGSPPQCTSMSWSLRAAEAMGRDHLDALAGTIDTAVARSRLHGHVINDIRCGPFVFGTTGVE